MDQLSFVLFAQPRLLSIIAFKVLKNILRRHVTVSIAFTHNFQQYQ